MAFFNSKGVSIAGMLTAVPKHIFKVTDSNEIFGADAVAKFSKKTGIKQMHRTTDDQTASDLGYAAADALLDKLSIAREKIGVLIFVSQSPDYRKPATACVLQHRLGLPMECAALDISLGCSGFVYGNQVMRSLMASVSAEYGLLIVAETSSKHADPKDSSIGMIFGDAGSAILYKNGTNETCTTLLKTDGSRFKSIIIPAGGYRDMNPDDVVYRDADGRERSKFYAYMDGLGVFAFSITDVPAAIEQYMQQENLSSDDMDYFILHQANHMIIKQIARKFKFPTEKVPLSLDRYGNTSGVAVPLTICDALGDKNIGVLKLLATGFGTGLSFGVTSFEIDTGTIFPIIETDDFYKEGKF